MLNRFLVVTVGLLLVLSVGSLSFGAEPEDTTESSATTEAGNAEKSDSSRGLVAIAAGLAVGLSALATGLAQSRIGAAGCGTLAEKPEAAGTIILLVAIPETMVILGFVIAIVLLFAV